jgi:hypothetical protein
MTKEAMKQALEALQEAVYKAGWIGMSPEGADEIQREVDEYVTHRLEPAITALRTAIAEAEKPVAVGEEHMTELINIADLLGTVELERRVGPNGHQSRVVKRDKNGVVTEVGDWQGPFVLETNHD